jgi:hypothetical protein
VGYNARATEQQEIAITVIAGGSRKRQKEKALRKNIHPQEAIPEVQESLRLISEEFRSDLGTEEVR